MATEAPRRRFTTLEFAGVRLLFAVPALLCTPWSPRVSTWEFEFQLHRVFAEKLQLGTDIIATYGPLGFATLPFEHPATYLLMLAINFAIYLWIAWRMRVALPQLSHLQAAGWVVLATLPSLFIFAAEWAPLQLASYVVIALFVAEQTLMPRPRQIRDDCLSALVLAVVSLTKNSLVPLTMLTVVLSTAVNLRRHRIPVVLAVYLLALAALWTASGQSWTGIDDFLFTSGEVIRGYKDGMFRWGGLRMIIFSGVSVACGVLLVASLAIRFGRRTLGIAVFSVAFGAMVYNLWLWGFIRADVFHVNAAWLATSMAGFAVLPMLRAAGSNEKKSHRAQIVAACVLTGFLIGGVTIGGPSKATIGLRRACGLPKLVAESLGWRQPSPPIGDLVVGQSERSRTPIDVPNIKGDPGDAWRTGGRILLRPTITAYGAYTPSLSSANAVFLRRPDGPQVVMLQQALSLDHIYPSLSDPRSFLALLETFQPVGKVPSYQSFRRRDQPVNVTFRESSKRVVQPGDVVPIPANDARGIWAKIGVEPRLLGRLFKSAFKPIPVYVTVTLDDGRSIAHRIVLELAADGFLLSPYVTNANDVSALMTDGGTGSLKHVVSLRIEPQVPSTSIPFLTFYQDSINVEFSEFDLRTVQTSDTQR